MVFPRSTSDACVRKCRMNPLVGQSRNNALRGRAKCSPSLRRINMKKGSEDFEGLIIDFVD